MPRRILLADDSVTAQNMGRKILTDAGYEVITVNNGSAALKKIGEIKPDLIVLDVYMPGYSGLEVCFRVKEARETADVPVLLTVGKLEPFKQDEARRARADAFIIKPFEASELLAALNKLEGTLVSGAKPHAPGESLSHPAKDMATFERYARENGPRYGDEESGWKARLKFPSGEQKAPEVSDSGPAQVSSGSSFRDRETTNSTPSTALPATRPPMERPIPAGIPQDITPEEIAALSAAAARVGMGFNSKEFKPLTKSATPPAPPVSEPAESEAKPETRVPTAAVEVTENRTAVDVPPAAGLSVPPPQAPAPGSETTPESAAALSTPPVNVVPAAAHAEVEAVLSSLAANPATAPVADGLVPNPPVAVEDEEVPEPVTIAAATTPEAAPATSAVATRWVAEEVPVGAAEAALMLEKEMHKAFAAFAAAEYRPSPYEPAPVDREDEPIFATMAPPAIGSPVPVAEVAPPESDSTEPPAAATKSACAAAAATAGGAPDTPRTLETSKPPAPFAPAATTLEEERHAVAAFGGPQPFGVSEAPASSEPVAVSAAPAEAVPDSTASESTPIIEESKPATLSIDSENRREAEIAAATAAAWANWRDIRESVVGDKPEVSAAAEVSPAAPAVKAAGGFEDFTAVQSPVEPATPEPEETADEAEAVSADSLSNIVDGMLAELKPKLMAELAKKLDKEKKDKKKKK